MFSNIYSCLSSAYNYLDSSIRNNPIIYAILPSFLQMIVPSLYSNILKIEGTNPFFTSVYDNLINNNKNNKNNKIIHQIDNDKMGCTSTNESKNNNVAREEITQVKKKKQAIPKKTRDAVWEKYHGNNDVGVCYCCGKNVTRDCWQAAHIISDSTGGQVTVDNLRVNCSHCNLSCGNQNLYAYIRDKDLKGPGRKNVNAYFKKNPSQINSKRTNNWGNNKKKNQQNRTNNNNNNNNSNKEKKNEGGWLSEWI